MKKQIQTIAFTCLWLMPSLIFSQVITKSFQGTVDNATCPGIGIQYEVSLPSGFNTCEIVWKITNGQKQSQSDNTVTAVWDDTPRAMGQVEVSFSDCDNKDNDGVTATPFEEPILSVNNQIFGFYTNSERLNG
mgnify:CR=1 FL=1